MKWKEPKAYPEKWLYLNLLKPASGMDITYEFRFLTKSEAENDKIEEGYFWFPVGEILNIHKFPRRQQLFDQASFEHTVKS